MLTGSGGEGQPNRSKPTISPHGLPATAAKVVNSITVRGGDP